MKICGLQKLTLLDYPGKVACTLFAGGCNFRCPFCQNGDLVLHPAEVPAIAEEEILSFLRKRIGLLDGVCITGGEPLLYPEVEDTIRHIREMGYAIKLDTNGSNPQRLKHLVEQGLVDYVAMDLKNCPERYAETIGIPGYDLSPIRESVAFLMSGAIPFEFRTTVVRDFHTPQDLVSLAKWVAGDEPYFLQGFVDSAKVIQKGLHGYEKADFEAIREQLLPYLPKTGIRGI